MNNINAFAVTSDEKFIIAGTLLGELLVIDVDTFAIQQQLFVSYGAINRVVIHPSLPYAAIHGEDNWLVILSWQQNTGELKILHTIRSRDIRPDDDPFDPCRTNSQALDFHHTQRRLVSRGGSVALFELEFDDNSYKILHCTRVHGPYDLITAVYVGASENVLSGSGNGVAILSNNGQIIKSWQLDGENSQSIHWFEPITDNHYVIASDTGKVLNLYLDGEMTAGPQVARDDLEHVTYHQSSGRIFSASFDRRICEIDMTSLAMKRVVWYAPFKLRWIKALGKEGKLLISQCRNGGLYKVDISKSSGKTLKRIKLNPEALWSAVVAQNKIIIAGEGSHYFTYTVAEHNALTRQPVFTEFKKPLASNVDLYTKRVIADEGSGMVAFARIDGCLIVKHKEKTIAKFKLHSPIRDACFSHDPNLIFVATESGHIYQVHILEKTITTLYANASPIWALAYNKKHQVLAFALRINHIYFYDTKKSRLINRRQINIETVVPRLHKVIKRMRWADDRYLFIGHSTNITRYDYENNIANTYINDVLPNTVEDFAWDKNQRYLVVVVYSRELYLCEFATGKVLYCYGDQADYSKGILFLDALENEKIFGGDFIVYGRYGQPRYHRINNDRIITLKLLTNGEVNRNFNQP